jgi:deoxyribodipyrimidine photo-lyase
MRTIVWFRGKDLRLADHAPLRAGYAKNGDEIIPLFVLDPYFFAPERARELPHRIQYLLESLEELAASLDAIGSKLLLASGKSIDVVPRLFEQLKADRVVAHRWSEPFGIERDARIAAKVRLQLFEGETLAAPDEVLTGGGTPFAVFTPFARAFAKTVKVGRPIAAPRELPPPPKHGVKSARIPSLADLGIERNPNLTPGGEKAAKARFAKFLRRKADRYHLTRNDLAEDGTSRISQDLKFGTLSARTVWNSTRTLHKFATELVWREFAYDILRQRPSVLSEPYRAAWKSFPWRKDAKALAAWKEGRTGYPVVDAAQRQLLAEGFVPGRARMITASFLAKHLLLDFRLGEAHFMKFLTDGDWANNDLGWQWSTGCGVDAQPWFRVFSPVSQGEKFDPDGAWVKRWVPELADLPAKYIHRPWDAPSQPRRYPPPIVEHAYARGRFLAAASGL